MNKNSNNTERMTFHHFIEKYKLNRIKSHLLSEEITMDFLFAQSPQQIDIIAQSITSNPIQQMKFKHAVIDIQQAQTKPTLPLKRKNPYSHDDTLNSNPKKRKTNHSSLEETCGICGTTMSLFLIDNHKRHCSTNYNKTDKDEQDADVPETQSYQPASNPSEPTEEERIECEYCECTYDEKSIADHKLYCGSRTDICSGCGGRDTLKHLMQNDALLCLRCTDTRTKQPKIHHNIPPPLPARLFTNEDTMIQAQIRTLELRRLLDDVRHILYDRYVVNYNKSSSLFEEYDAFGYQQKTNGFASNHNGTNNNTNGGKSREELRSEYSDKYKQILHVLNKILRNIQKDPFNAKYHTLKCDNVKLKSLIFGNSACCEWLKLCGFEYMNSNNGYYTIKKVDIGKIRSGLSVLEEVEASFDGRVQMDNEEQKKWESNQAVEKNEHSLFYKSWSCKHCNHLNRRTWKCTNCKKRKHKTPKKARKEVQLSVERWVCRFCKNRTSTNPQTAGVAYFCAPKRVPIA
eukprot:789672_1